MKSEWKLQKLSDFFKVNPSESLKADSIAVKISMDALIPFQREVSSKIYARFTGGSKFRNGDTIMARITPCLENGKCAQVNCLKKNEVGFGSTEFIVFRNIEGVSDCNFIYYLVRSDFIREPAIKSMVGSSGRQRVQTDVVKQLSLRLPDISTQRRIAAILSSLDDKIDLNNKINANLQEQAQALFKSWFVDFEPWGGVMPEDWREGRFSDFATICYGKDHKELSDGPYPVYGSGGIMRYVDRYIHDEESILIPRKGTLNNIIYCDEPFWSVDTMFYTKMKNKKFARYGYYCIKKYNLESMNSGSAVPSMTAKTLNELKVILPSFEYVHKFDDIISPLYAMISANTKESKKLAKLRDTLLPKLMSGELDVSDVELSEVSDA